MGQPCPRCGGENRFYLVVQPRKGGPPFWLCNQCRYVEGGAAEDAAAHPPLRKLTPDELAQAQRGYAAVADWCATYLWSPAEDARAALAYLRGRGFRDDTIITPGLGSTPTHGKTWLAG